MPCKVEVSTEVTEAQGVQVAAGAERAHVAAKNLRNDIFLAVLPDRLHGLPHSLPTAIVREVGV